MSRVRYLSRIMPSPQTNADLAGMVTGRHMTFHRGCVSCASGRTSCSSQHPGSHCGLSSRSGTARSDSELVPTHNPASLPCTNSHPRSFPKRPYRANRRKRHPLTRYTQDQHQHTNKKFNRSVLLSSKGSRACRTQRRHAGAARGGAATIFKLHSRLVGSADCVLSVSRKKQSVVRFIDVTHADARSPI